MIKVILGIVLICLTVWGIARLTREDGNQSPEIVTQHESPLLVIEPAVIQPGHIVTATWNSGAFYTDTLQLDIPPYPYTRWYSWDIENSAAEIFTFTLPITFNRISPVLFRLTGEHIYVTTSVLRVCSRDWFFEPRSLFCPAKVKRTRAWQQDFENGMKIRLEHFVNTRLNYGLLLEQHEESVIRRVVYDDAEGFGAPIGPEREFWMCYTSAPTGYNTHNTYFNDAHSRIVVMRNNRWAWSAWWIYEGEFIGCDDAESEP